MPPSFYTHLREAGACTSERASSVSAEWWTCTPHWQAAALKEVEGRRASSESPVTPGKAREHPLGSAAAGDTVAVGSEGVVVGHGAGWSTGTAAGCRVRGRLDTGVSAASGDGGEECVCGAGWATGTGDPMSRLGV